MDLGATTEVLDDAVQLGQANHFTVAVVANLGNTGEQEEVVFTHRGEGDIFLEDDGILHDRESGAGGEVLRYEPSAQLSHIHLGHTVWCLLDGSICHVEAHGLHDLLELPLNLENLFSFSESWYLANSGHVNHRVLNAIGLQIFRYEDS